MGSRLVYKLHDGFQDRFGTVFRFQECFKHGFMRHRIHVELLTELICFLGSKIALETAL